MDWLSTMTTLGQEFAPRSVSHDRDDAFVAENFRALRLHKAFAAGVPGELGGGDASHTLLCHMVRELSKHCGSTGLAFSMHTHLVGTLAFLWRRGNKTPEGMLKRVAAEGLVLVSTGGSDWLPGSGRLERVEGGYRMTGRKVFGSGVPGGDLLMTTGIYDDPTDGPTVYHFPVSLKADGVHVLDTWRALGMRGTGSHDVELTDVFLPDAVMQGVRRPAGKWHPFMHAVALAALPIIYSAYMGVADHAREIAIGLAAKKREDPLTPVLVGELENLYVTAVLAREAMVHMAATSSPSPETTVAMLTRRTILVNALLRFAEKALEVGGGAGFYRSTGLELCFRDLQGARYHPVQEKTQTRLTGRHLLGLPLDD